MIFTLFYVYSTLIQWWRLGHLRNKLNGTLNSHNSLVACTGGGASIADSKNKRCLENLLFHNEDRLACTVVPKQKVDLTLWARFPKDPSYFPLYIGNGSVSLRPPNIYLLIRAEFSEYNRRAGEGLQVEEFGELLAWKADDEFEVILRTDLVNLTKIVSCFSDHHLDINHDLKLIRLETVEIEGSPCRIKYELRYPLDNRTNYSVAPVYWKRFVQDVKTLYAKVQEAPTRNKILDKPTITIDIPESKAKSHHGKVAKKESKNKLEVGSEKRKSKSKTKIKKEKHHSNGDIKERVIAVPDIRNNMADENGYKTIVSTKPPNVLVFSESAVARDNVKSVLGSIINKQKYVLYDFPTQSKVQVWRDTTILVVVCGSVPPELTSQFLDYLLSGGNLLCLCSDFLYSVLNIFSTAEVREHELVRFSYENWKRIKMMHHVFCYQASPAKRQFSKDSDHSNSSRGSSPVAPRMPSVVEIQHNGRKHIVQVQVLGTEETWQTPSLLLAQSKGSAVFSQVHLEIDPNQYQDDENKYKALMESNAARLDILKHILVHHLNMDCSVTVTSCYVPAYLLGMHLLKHQLLSEDIKDNKIIGEKLTMQFYDKGEDPAQADANFLPILINSNPSNFSTIKYFEALTTTEFGRLVIYADVLTSSQTILETSLKHGLAVIVRQQTRGVGRAGNTWLSPMGCAMFSLQLHIPVDSILGKALSLIQHLVMVSILSAIRSLEGYENLKLGLKWPNDLYANGSIKIGGLVVNSSVFAESIIVTIGVGVNLDNVDPTTCINEIIKVHNAKYNTKLPPIQFEQYFALVFSEIERIYLTVQAGDLDSFFNLYYKYWLHSGAEVTVSASNGRLSKAKIIGIDEYGYLQVRYEDGSITSVHPDGNTFDMMQGLIAPKVF